MKKIFLLFCMLNFHFAFAQNLVPNPGFEDTLGCAENVWPALPCANWYSALYSPDYYSNSYSCFAGVYPLDYQNPRSGLSYAGMYFWQQPACIREFIGVKLTAPLIAGHEYCLELYYTRHESYGYATNRIGAYFSPDTAVTPPNGCNLPFVPQISTPFNHPPLDDTLNWVLFSGSFIAAGGEQFMTLGNLFPDDSTVATHIGGPYDCAYYMFDDVSLVDCSVGIPAANEESSFRVFADAEQNQLHIQTIEPDEFRITIFDLSGKMIAQEQFRNQYSLNLKNLPAGTYLYEIRNSGEVRKTGKFVTVQ